MMEIQSIDNVFLVDQLVPMNFPAAKQVQDESGATPLDVSASGSSRSSGLDH
jgi:hypothetical protein